MFGETFVHSVGSTNFTPKEKETLMFTRTLLSAALVTSSLLFTNLASAATTVTFNPAATNGAQALALSGDAQFQAVGFQSNLASVLTISGNSGVQTFSETGTIDVTSFVNSANATVASGVFANYHIIGNFSISGSGIWSGSQYTANPAGLSFVVNLIGDPGALGGPTINLGTATLVPGPAVAFAIAFGSLAPGSSGSALTSLTANMNFTPGPGTNGVGGFFVAPNPLNLLLSIGNAGGNPQNTGYTVAGNGSVSFTNPIPGTNSGTANVTFNQQAVPEPGALSLVAVALLGVAFVSKRKKETSV